MVGLASDLQALRAGQISNADATTRAALAKQIMNGVRLVFTATRFLEERATALPEIAPPAEPGENRSIHIDE